MDETFWPPAVSQVLSAIGSRWDLVLIFVGVPFALCCLLIGFGCWGVLAAANSQKYGIMQTALKELGGAIDGFKVSILLQNACLVHAQERVLKTDERTHFIVGLEFDLNPSIANHFAFCNLALHFLLSLQSPGIAFHKLSD